jgi:hypothetical protein
MGGSAETMSERLADQTFPVRWRSEARIHKGEADLSQQAMWENMSVLYKPRDELRGKRVHQPCCASPLSWHTQHLCHTKYDTHIPQVCGARLRLTSVSIATSYGLDDQKVAVRVPVRARIFISPCLADRLWGPPSLLCNVYRGPFPGGKAAETWSWPLTSN